MGLFSTFKKLLPAIGTAAGSAIGGPAGASIGGALGSAVAGTGGGNKKAIAQAQAAQQAAINQAIALQERQFGITNANISPFVNAGQAAQQQINELLGLATAGSPGTVDWAAYVNGNPDALANWNAVRGTPSDSFGDVGAFGQYHYGADGSRRDLAPFTVGASAGGIGDTAAAYDRLKASPLYTSLFDNGREAILGSASATGGLRGGNVNASLADFGRDTLAQVIQQQLANLGGIASQGVNAAGTLAGYGANSANGIGGLMTNIGNTQAGSILGQQAITNTGNSSLNSSLGGIDFASLLKNLNLGSGGGSAATVGGVNNIPAFTPSSSMSGIRF